MFAILSALSLLLWLLLACLWVRSRNHTDYILFTSGGTLVSVSSRAGSIGIETVSRYPKTEPISWTSDPHGRIMEYVLYGRPPSDPYPEGSFTEWAGIHIHRATGYFSSMRGTPASSALAVKSTTHSVWLAWPWPLGSTAVLPTLWALLAIRRRYRRRGRGFEVLPPDTEAAGKASDGASTDSIAM